jgi:hypothetical protein
MARRRVTYLAARVAFITDSYASTQSAPVRVAGRPTGLAYLAGRGRVDAGESGVEKPERHDAVPAAGPSGLLHQAMAVGANTFGTSHEAHVTVEGGDPRIEFEFPSSDVKRFSADCTATETAEHVA